MLELRCFNLMRGLVIFDGPNGGGIVLMNVRRDADTEQVHCFGRKMVGHAGAVVAWAQSFDYNDTALVIGVVANPDDFGDTDIGTDAVL